MTTCGCSAGKPTKTSLESLEEGFIEVTMDTRKFTRRKDSNVIITIDSPLHAEIRIPITAYIRTDVVFDPGKDVMGQSPGLLRSFIDCSFKCRRSLQGWDFGYRLRGDGSHWGSLGRLC